MTEPRDGEPAPAEELRADDVVDQTAEPVSAPAESVAEEDLEGPRRRARREREARREAQARAMAIEEARREAKRRALGLSAAQAGTSGRGSVRGLKVVAFSVVGSMGMVMIAIALASNPKLLLADEPTTALDVTIQKQILKLILDLSKDLGMAVILVTHDLGVAAQTCDRLAVMYGGKLVETGATREVLRAPKHRYTMGLLQSVPENIEPRTPLFSLPGTPPSLMNLPLGCAFAPRCAHSVADCAEKKPPLIGEQHQVACFNPTNSGEATKGVA